jgi:hypothetical protein
MPQAQISHSKGGNKEAKTASKGQGRRSRDKISLLGAVFPWPDGGDPRSRPRDVASLSKGGQAEPQSPPGLSAARKEPAVRGGFPRRALRDAVVDERKVPDAQPGRTDSGASPSMTRGFLEAEVPEQ